MQPLTGERVEKADRPAQQSFDFNAQGPAARSPGPSRLAFRMARLWKTPWVRRAVFTGVPAFLLIGFGVKLATSPAVHAVVAEQRAAVMDRLSARPEFAIRGARIAGASQKLGKEVRELIAVPPGASTLNFDVAAAQTAVNEMPAVRSAHVTLAPDGMLDIHIQERLPAALWRDRSDRLWLIDAEGIVLGLAGARADHPALPVLLGDAANRRVAQALDLLRTAPELTGRIRALVRVGQRRWNIVLDRGLTIMLPETGARAALERVMAWHRGPDKVLDRGLSHVDLRVADRPALRMTPKALESRPLDERLRDGSGEET